MSVVRSVCLVTLAMLFSPVARGGEDFTHHGEKTKQKQVQHINASNDYVRLLADIPVLLAGFHLLTENYDCAIKDCDLAIRLDAKNHDAYVYRGISFWMKRDYERSLADSNEAIHLDPTDASSFNWRGDVHVLKGEWTKALSD
jgi:tetratricopeptide (TPR) repeat protein